MARTREQLRTRMLPGISRLARSRDFRSTFAKIFSNPQQQTIIAALPNDSVGYVLDRLRDAGGTAVLVMPKGDAFEMAALTPASPARIAVAEEDDTLTQVNEACDVEMLFAYLNQVGTAVISRVAAKLVDHGQLQLT